jgi:hypothetical protein
VIGVDTADGLFQTPVDVDYAVVQLVSWFVDWVVASRQYVIFTSCGNLFPKPNNSVFGGLLKSQNAV